MHKYFTYILFSPKINKFYVGSTDNISWRLERHNLGWGRFTKSGIPWHLVYFEDLIRLAGGRPVPPADLSKLGRLKV